jgi:hypothetical protein
LVVIQYEQFFELPDDPPTPDQIAETLETMRMYGGARVVGSYETEENQKFLDKAVSTITINAPVRISVD